MRTYFISCFTSPNKQLIWIIEENECETGNNDCSQNCENTFEGYTCSCLEGYELLEDNKTCKGCCL